MAMRPIRSSGVAVTPNRRKPVGLIYEDFKPLSEWRRQEEADTLVVHLPGFMKEMIKVTTENRNIVRIRGERVLTGNKWSRFQEDYQVPEYCDMRGIRAKFEGGILAVTMPRKIIATVVSPRVTSTPRIREQPDQETRRSQDTSANKLVPSPHEFLETQDKGKKESNIPDVNDQKEYAAPKKADAENENGKSSKNDPKGPSNKALGYRDIDAEKQKKKSFENDKKGPSNKASVYRDIDAEKQKEMSSDNDQKGPSAFKKEEADIERVKSSKYDQKARPNKALDDRDIIPRVFVPTSSSIVDAEKQQKHGSNDVFEGNHRGKEPMAGENPKVRENVTLTPSYKVEDYKKMVAKGLGMGKNEERELLVNMGVAVLVIVALGTYTFRSFSNE